MEELYISGRKEIIAEFKDLVSSFPEEMGNMQGQLRKHKETASDVHSLHADVQSLSSILDRKVSIFFVFEVLWFYCMAYADFCSTGERV